MIKLINNEFVKVKKSKLILTEILYIISIIVINKYSDKSIFDLVFNLIPFIGIIVCILYGGIISKERENGNLRFYLTKPVKRWKVYLSKFISIMLYIIVSNIIIVCTVILINGYDKLFIIKYIKHSIPVFFIGSYILYLSTVFKSQTFSSSFGIITLSFSLLISQLLFGIRITFVEYTFLPYLDFSLFNDELVLNEINNDLGVNLSMNRGVIIDIIYMIIFYLIGNYKFIKKDIKS